MIVQLNVRDGKIIYKALSFVLNKSASGSEMLEALHSLTTGQLFTVFCVPGGRNVWHGAEEHAVDHRLGSPAPADNHFGNCWHAHQQVGLLPSLAFCCMHACMGLSSHTLMTNAATSDWRRGGLSCALKKHALLIDCISRRWTVVFSSPLVNCSQQFSTCWVF